MHTETDYSTGESRPPRQDYPSSRKDAKTVHEQVAKAFDAAKDRCAALFTEATPSAYGFALSRHPYEYSIGVPHFLLAASAEHPLEKREKLFLGVEIPLANICDNVGTEHTSERWLAGAEEFLLDACQDAAQDWKLHYERVSTNPSKKPENTALPGCVFPRNERSYEIKYDHASATVTVIGLEKMLVLTADDLIALAKAQGV